MSAYDLGPPDRRRLKLRAVCIAFAWARGERLPLILFIGSLVTLAVPLLLVPIPPLLDYPNHLVRLWLITGGAAAPPLSGMYAVSWSNAYTNVGIDWVGALLGFVVPAVPLGSFFMLLALVLPPVGAALLNRGTFGGLHWSHVAFVFFAWNATLIAGFLNFQIGIGLAMLGAALEPRLAQLGPVPRSAARLAIGLALLIVHVFALFYYCALVAGIAFGREFAGLASWRGFARRIPAALVAAAPAAVPALAYLALAPSLPGAHTDAIGNAPLWDFSLYNKGHVLLSPIATYALPIDILFAAAVLAPLVYAALSGRVEAHAGLVLATGALALLAILSPTAIAGTWWIDNRFPLMALFALLAGLRPHLPRAQTEAAAKLPHPSTGRGQGWVEELGGAPASARWPDESSPKFGPSLLDHSPTPAPPRQGEGEGKRRTLGRVPLGATGLALLLAALVAARTGWITSIWLARAGDIDALHRAVAAIPPGSAVLPLDDIDPDADLSAFPLGRYFHNGHPTHWSFPVLAVMWRQAFVPNLFWAAGKQPLRVLPPWTEICFAEDGLWASRALVDPELTPPYFRSWRERYDYVLLINADAGHGADLSALPELRLERDEGFARLYRIVKPHGRRPAAEPGAGHRQRKIRAAA